MSGMPTSRGRLLVVNWQDLENPLAGGAEVHLQENLKRLAAVGFDVTLLCSSFKGAAPEAQWEGVRILRRGGRFDFNWRVPLWIRGLVRQETFDLLIEDINKIPFYSPLYQPLPVLAVVPHLFATTVFHEINFLLASYIYACEYPVRWAYRGVPFTVISDSTRDDLVERGFKAGDVEVIHCGIDKSLYRVDPEIAKSADPLVLYLGRLKKYKSVQHLISAFAGLRREFPTAKLLVVGDGTYRGALEQHVQKLGLMDHITFTGFIPSADKVRYLQQAWIAVCPSLKEGWGLTNIEANACGTAVIAADVPGLRDSVQHGTNGYLYPYGDVLALSQSLHRLLNDSAERRLLQEGAVTWAKRFDWDHAAQRLAKLIDGIIKRSGGPR